MPGELVEKVPLGHGYTIESYSVGSWCPTPDGSGKPVAVSLALNIVGMPVMVMRLKTRHAVNEMIEALARHRDDVFGAAPKSNN